MKNQKIKILIPNATSPKNIGDLAMLTAMLGIFKKVYRNPHVVIHSTDYVLHDKNIADRVSHTIYSWIVFDNRDTLIRIYRALQTLFVYFFLKLGILYVFFDAELRNLIDDYKESDLIIFVGGGYLRTKRGISQSLNLMMLLFHFQLSKLFKAKKIVAPISFGPFAYKWQESLSAKVLSGMDMLSAREIFSYRLMKKNNLKKTMLSSDHAFLLENTHGSAPSHKNFVLGFTVRNWLDGKRQSDFEKHFFRAILKFSNKTNSAIQPIIQVDAPLYGDNDLVITRKISRHLKDNGVKVLKIKRNSNLKSSMVNYSTIDMLLGMRMHSNIIATIQNKPFVAISYEHKTEGISKQLGMGGYCIKVEDVNEDNLYELLITAYKNYDRNRLFLKKKLGLIRDRELTFWKNTLKLEAVS